MQPHPSPASASKSAAGPMRVAGWVLFALCLVPLALTVRPSFSLSHDAATYAILGESLAMGRGYTYQGYAHVKYPPGYPALLAGLQRLTGRDVTALRIFTAACGAGALLLAWRLAASRSGEFMGAGVLALMAATAFFVDHAAFTLSDIPFMACLAGTCLAGRKLLERPRPGQALLTGALLLAGASMRLVGVLAGPALLLAWLTRRGAGSGQRRGALGALSIVACMLFIGLYAWSRHQATAGPLLPETTREGATYAGEVQGGLWLGVPQGFVPNLLFQLRVKPVILTGTCAGLLTGERVGRAGQSGWAAPGAPLSILLTVLLLAAAARSLWHHRGILDWFFWLYLGVLMVTPPFYGLRYFIPVLPFLWAALLESAQALGGKRSPPALRLGLLGVVLGVALAVWAGPLVRTVAELRAQPTPEGHAGAFRAGLEFLEKNAPEGAVIICNEAALTFYLTGKPAFGFPLTTPEEVAAYIDDKGDLVLLSTWGYPVNEDLLRKAVDLLQRRNRLEMIYWAPRTPDAWTAILAIKRAGN